MQKNNEKFHSDKLEIDNIVKIFFSIFTNTGNRQPAFELINETCIAQTVIIKKINHAELIYNIDNFIEPRKKILTDGTLTDFEETETKEETKIIGNIAQRFSRYRKTGYLNGIYFKEHGNKIFQFIKTIDGWKINSLVWEDDAAE